MKTITLLITFAAMICGVWGGIFISGNFAMFILSYIFLFVIMQFRSLQYDYVIEVPDTVVNEMLEFDRLEAAYQRRQYHHKANYSLDRGDGIEHELLFLSLTPYEIYERKVTY